MAGAQAGPHDLAELDATETAEWVRTGRLTAGAAVEAAITRIERLDPVLHAVVRTRFEEARADAITTSSADVDRPLHGVPFLLKDLGAHVAGQRTDYGAAILQAADVRWPVSSYVSQAFARAGLVDLGRSATPEFGTTITTEPAASVPTRNPWSPGFSAGGSSGGAAAAVASGMVPVAHAGDGGGSIRIPASCCGLVGLKASRGRVSHGPQVGESWAGSTTDGALTRTVRDAALMLDVIRGRRTGDPYSAPEPERPYTAEVGRPPGRLRVGVLTGPGREGAPAPHRECVHAVETAAGDLADLGHEVVRAHPEAMTEPRYAAEFLTVVVADLALTVTQLERVLGRSVADEELEPRNARYRQAGRALAATDYLAARGWLGQWARRMARWWAAPEDDGDGYDLLLCPVLATTPPEIGWYTAGGPGDEDARIASVLQYTGQFNATGQPALSLPLHVSADGLPIGVQLVADAGREDVLVRVAAQLESAKPWRDRRPRVWAGHNGSMAGSTGESR